MIIKSPLNYSGSKNYIVDQIIKYIPANLDVFVDSMGGAFNVGANVNCARTVIYNEYNPFVYEMINMLLTQEPDKLIAQIEEVIRYFDLSKGNKIAYIRLRDYYNRNKHPLLLFVLQMFCYQNQLRFNCKHDFNTPVGNGGYNKTVADRIRIFGSMTKNVQTICGDYKSLDLCKYPKNTLFYFDPPYLITNATYNDGKRGFKGWNAEQEIELLSFLDSINLNGQKFLLSNIICHNGKTNDLLLNWTKQKQYNIVELTPHRGRYGARKEVLIKNY